MQHRKKRGLWPLAFCFVVCGAIASAQTVASARKPVHSDWQQHEIFLNSDSQHGYFYSAGRVSEPSTLKLVQNRLPVVTTSFFSAPNALKLAWTSNQNGEWDAELHLPTWPNRSPGFRGNTLSFWIRSAEDMRLEDLPRLSLRDSSNGFTQPVALGQFVHELHAARWTLVSIPLARLTSASVRPFPAERLSSVVFLQGSTDGAPHTLLLDDVRLDDAPVGRVAPPPAPLHLQAKGYERHVLLTWDASPAASVEGYTVYRSTDGEHFTAVATTRPDMTRAVDFVGRPGMHLAYRVTARAARGVESRPTATVSTATHPMSDAELLTMVQEASFSYYWEGAEPNSGLARESLPGDPDMIAVGGSGFGIMSLIVGAERGFAPREAIVDRMLRITGYLARADRFHGAWPHFLSGSTGHILPAFGLYDDGADIVETSFMMQGLLAARGYFTRDTPKETRLREEITTLWRGVEWDWFNATPQHDGLYWHWSPNFGFRTRNRLNGWNETLIPYLLGIASPTHPIPPGLYYSGWAAGGNPSRHFGEPSEQYGEHLAIADPHGTTGPLFFTDYSFMGYDPRGVRDKYADYFANNRNMCLAQLHYAEQNPGHFVGYGKEDWGMSAVTGPFGYRAFHPPTTDDGTLAPTAAVSAYAYVPEASMDATRHFYRDLGAAVWDVYGFRNAFNETQDWYAPGELALNQAPQAVMIENGRTGLVWKSFMSNPEMPAMQQAIGLAKSTESSK